MKIWKRVKIHYINVLIIKYGNGNNICSLHNNFNILSPFVSFFMIK